MFASVGLGAFLIVILLVRIGMWAFRRRERHEVAVAEPIGEEDADDLQTAIDRWDRIQSRHSHSMYWDE